ncbi:transporter substrate-binding domain-containing protein [Bacteriovorax sp. PP10]|uniref:Transporter substrate-binding domain-containing protein n=1 Tax=Bacteriovorax antarcticus TaxID=3088717 RepID=A0ABU5VT50_9BACT|nr:transporter substrate-binding domain-containing protein [Bacteriovorax sp. PP10]MEA9356231.1 transporter substrate-binding domain-containing protein [Bacteriovorax sp. PP10]
MKLYLILFLLFYSLDLVAQESIQVYSPYDSPPYVLNLEKGEGLVFDFVKELNETFKGKYHFVANFVTRGRLKIIFDRKDFAMIVPFVNPVWFDDMAEKKFLWTQEISKDCNVIIYRHDKPLHIKKLDDLTGLSTSVVNGQLNINIQKLYDQKKIRVENANNVVLNFLKLSKRRVDFLVIGYTLADYIIRNNKLFNLEIVETPVDVFNRKILVFSKKDARLGAVLRDQLSLMIKNGKIQKMFNKYELNSHPSICNNKLVIQ